MERIEDDPNYAPESAGGRGFNEAFRDTAQNDIRGMAQTPNTPTGGGPVSAPSSRADAIGDAVNAVNRFLNQLFSDEEENAESPTNSCPKPN